MKKWIFIILLLPAYLHSFSWNRYLRRMDTVRFRNFNYKHFLSSKGGKRVIPQNKAHNAKILKTLLSSNEVDDKAKGIITAAKLKFSGLSDHILKLLEKEKSAYFKKLFIWCIGEIGANKHVLALTQYSYKINDKKILNTLSLAIGKIARRGGSVTPLINILNNSNDLMVQSSTLLSLGKIKARRALPIILKKLKDRNKEIRFCAAIALAYIIKESDNLKDKIFDMAFEEESNYVKAALYYVILKNFGWQRKVYQRLVWLLKIPGVSNAAIDFLVELPYQEGLKYLDFYLNGTSNRILRYKLTYVIARVRNLLRREYRRRNPQTSHS